LSARTIIFLNAQFVYFIARFRYVYDKLTTLFVFLFVQGNCLLDKVKLAREEPMTVRAEERFAKGGRHAGLFSRWLLLGHALTSPSTAR